MSPSPSRSPRPRPTCAAYKTFFPIETRWTDNDVYGHVNNARYYELFDSGVNRVLVGAGLDIHAGPAIALVVESSCRYHAPTTYPERLLVGVRVDHLGTSSIVYGVAVFSESSDEAAADGSFVHVFVDRATRRPVPLPPSIRVALEALRAPPAAGPPA
jgi:acyl-CoA thioester hydrolase